MIRGRTVAVYVNGPSGSGKTALARQFVDDLIDREAVVVLAGRCYEQESVPYKALDGVIDALGKFLKRLPLLEAGVLLPRDVRSLLRVFPALAESEAAVRAPRNTADVPDPHELRRRAFVALRELLARLGDRRPLVVVIDDMQWGDTDSAALLAELLRPPDPPRLLLLGCYRTDDASTSPFLRAMLAPQDGVSGGLDRRVLEVGALDPSESERLALELLGGDGAAVGYAGAVARESGGSPFFIAELVRHVQAGMGLVGRGGTPGELELDEALWARVRKLPDEARRLLEVVAVSGRPLGQVEAARAAGLDDGGRAVLAQLKAGRLVRGSGSAEDDRVEAYHDRVREAVVARIPAADLRGHHLNLAAALEASGCADPEVLAVHYQGAGDPSRAGWFYERAASEAAESLAFERAAKLYRLAIDLSPPDPAERRRLRVATGDALANAGRGAQAAQEYLAAAEGATPAESFEYRRRAALQYLINGRLDEGFAELSAVLDTYGLSLPRTPRRAILLLLLARLRLRLRGLGYRPRDVGEVPPDLLARIEVCWGAVASLGAIDPIRGAYFQARGLLYALRAGEPFRIYRSLMFEAVHVGALGGRHERRAQELIRSAEALEPRYNDPTTAGRITLTKAMATYYMGRWREAVLLFDQAGETIRSESIGFTWEIGSTGLYPLWCLQYLGEIAEMGRRWPALLHEARERGDQHTVTVLSSFLLSTLRLAADDTEGAEGGLRQAVDWWPHCGFLLQHNEWYGAHLQVKLYRGDAHGAWDLLSGEYAPALGRSHLMRFQKVRVFLYERRARCALAAAETSPRPGPLLRAAEADARRLRRERMPWSDAFARLIAAGLASARGNRDRALGELVEAVRQLEAVDMHLHAAAARRRLGEALGTEEGRVLVEQADLWMSRQGIKKPTRMTEVFAAAVR